MLFSALSVALKTAKHPAQGLKGSQGPVPAWLHKAVSFKQLSKNSSSIHLRVIWSTTGRWCVRETQGVIPKKNRQDANQVWEVHVPPSLLVNLWHRGADGQQREVFTYPLLWDDKILRPQTVENRSLQDEASQPPDKNAPEDHINQHVLTAADKSHCLKPHVILEYLLLFFTAVFQGSFSLWTSKSLILLHLPSHILFYGKLQLNLFSGRWP